ncbi:MAG: GntR family transcriptional regulator [Chitinivibrionales bacterium]|nr:GntR family transcriptional regulator [Chitinivibrionales bacterium]
MNSLASKPALKAALIAIAENVANTESGILPPIAGLAAQADVSFVTMLKAADYCKAHGILRGSRGRRFEIAEGARAECREMLNALGRLELPRDTAQASHVWQRLKKQLCRDLGNGVYRPGTALPPQKVLQNRYSVSFRTLKKALLSLQDEGLLEVHKKSFAVPQLSSRILHSRIVFLAIADETGKITLGGANEEFVRNLQLECTVSSVSLNLYGYFGGELDLGFVDSTAKRCPFPDDDSILGYIFLVMAAEPKLPEVLVQLAHVNKPLAIVDVSGDWSPPVFLQNRLCKHFTYAVSCKSSLTIGRFLLQGGHRHLAYLSPFHRARWSLNRLKGLQQACREVTGSSVTPVVLKRPPKIAAHYRNLTLERCDLTPLQEFYHTWKRHIPAHYSAALDELFRFTIPVRILTQAAFQHEVEALFEQAFRHADTGRISVWVAANDDVARQACTWLRRKRVAIPRELSVTGFDDTREAMQEGLTSYNFNVRALAHAVLTYIVNRESYLSRYGAKDIEFDGMIVERTSSGAAEPVG